MSAARRAATDPGEDHGYPYHPQARVAGRGGRRPRSLDEDRAPLGMASRRKRGFGQLRRLPSKRWQAFYTGPDTALHYAPFTFLTAEDGEAWLAAERRLITAGEWKAPKVRREDHSANRALTLSVFSEQWLEQRDLKPRTKDHYQSLLDRQILPHLGSVPLKSLTSEMVRGWYAQMDPARPTLRAHAYGLLRTLLGTAVTEEIVPANPCRIRGAGNVTRTKRITPATLHELEVIAKAMPVKYRPMVMLSSWCALRFGELIELRKMDIDLDRGVILVRRGVVRTGGTVLVGTPKSAAGVRDVAIPPHLNPMLREHLASVTGGKDALLFPAADGVSHLAPSTLYRVFYRARECAGRPDLRWHDLRHTGAVLAAQTGATLAELMARLGHSTPQAALRYQHAAQGRDAAIALALSRMAESGH